MLPCNVVWYHITRCDSWSAGVVMFIVLSGQYPFHGKTKDRSSGLAGKWGKLPKSQVLLGTMVIN